MIDRHLYRYTEQALRNFPHERARLQLLKEYLSSPVAIDVCVQGGEDADSETGISHMAHAAWGCFTLLAYVDRGVGTDDREEWV